MTTHADTYVTPHCICIQFPIQILTTGWPILAWWLTDSSWQIRNAA